jgi:hypothetical protein
LRVEIVDRAVDGEHAGRFADAHHLLPGQLPVDIARQRGQVADRRDVGFLVQDRLPEVCDAPALGNVELEQFGELRSSLAGDGVAPGAEGRQQTPSWSKAT